MVCDRIIALRFSLFEGLIHLLTKMKGMDSEIYEEVVCRHCDGSGCTYCDKSGRVSARKPACLCKRCGGDGCIYCGYTGWADVKGKYEQ